MSEQPETTPVTDSSRQPDQNSRQQKIANYLKELSIVIVGVLITLGITTFISNYSKKQEVKESLNLVVMELDQNMKLLDKLLVMHQEEIHIYRLLRGGLDDLKSIPVDTLDKYSHTIGNLNRFVPVTDAYEMFKISSLIPYVNDKALLLDLIQVYSQIESLASGFDNYVSTKQELLNELFKGSEMGIFWEEMTLAFEQDDYYSFYSIFLRSDVYRGFIHRATTMIDPRSVTSLKSEIRELSDRITARYLK